MSGTAALVSGKSIDRDSAVPSGIGADGPGGMSIESGGAASVPAVRTVPCTCAPAPIVTLPTLQMSPELVVPAARVVGEELTFTIGAKPLRTPRTWAPASSVSAPPSASTATSRKSSSVGAATVTSKWLPSGVTAAARMSPGRPGRRIAERAGGIEAGKTAAVSGWVTWGARSWPFQGMCTTVLFGAFPGCRMIDCA
jgi:hypothetical protein